MPTLTIQGTGVDNVWIRELAPTENPGSHPFLLVRTATTDSIRSALSFDFSSIPSDIIIISATLSLYFDSLEDSTPAGRTYEVNRLTQIGWVELQATWNNYKTSNAWIAGGGDFTITNQSTAIVPSVGNWIDFDVKSQTEYAIVNTSDIAHFLIKDASEDESTTRTARFHSTQGTGGDTSLRPKLVIVYVNGYIQDSPLSITTSVLSPADVTDNTMLPNTLAISASILAPTIPINITLTPSALSISASILAPTIDLLLTASPSVLAITTSLLAPTPIIINHNVYTLEADLPAHTIKAIMPAAISMEQDLPALTLEASLKSGQLLTMEGNLPVLTLVSHMGMRMEAMLPALTLSSVMTIGNVASVERNLPALTLVASMASGRVMTLTTNLLVLTLSANLVNGNILTLAQTLSALTLEALGTTGNNMSLSKDLPALTLVSTSRADEAYTLTATLPALELEAFTDNYLDRYI